MNRRKIALATGGASLLVVASLTGLALSAPDARAQAIALLADVAKSQLGSRVASESVKKAQDALKRADQMRASGDQQHGAAMEETALEWATASQLLRKTAEREKQVVELQTRITELETKVFRAQALVEQTVARRARAEEALRKLEANAEGPSGAPAPGGGR